MKRRQFINSGALWLPAIFVPRLIRAQSLGRNPAFLGAASQQAPSGGSQSAAYIGNNLDGSGNMVVDDASGTISTLMAWGVSFTCPGSGTRTLDQLGCFCSDPSPSHNIRLAIYTAAGAFVAQTVKFLVTSSSAAWFTSASFLNQALATLNPVNVTGGSSYILACSAEAGQLVHYKIISGGAYNVQDATTNGYPASLPSGTTVNAEFGVRGHVAAI